jgi:hypothetical protein
VAGTRDHEFNAALASDVAHAWNTLSYRHRTSRFITISRPNCKENRENPSISLATRSQQAVGPKVQFD